MSTGMLKQFHMERTKIKMSHFSLNQPFALIIIVGILLSLSPSRQISILFSLEESFSCSGSIFFLVDYVFKEKSEKFLIRLDPLAATGIEILFDFLQLDGLNSLDVSRSLSGVLVGLTGWMLKGTREGEKFSVEFSTYLLLQPRRDSSSFVTKTSVIYLSYLNMIKIEFYIFK